GCHTASSRKIRAGHRRVSQSPRGRHRARREKSPGAQRSRGKTPCHWEPEVRRWALLAPYEAPRPSGKEWKCQELSLNILLICSVYKKNIDLGRGRKHVVCAALPLHVRRVARAAAVAK